MIVSKESYYEFTFKEHGHYDWSFNRNAVIRFTDSSKLMETLKFLEDYKGKNIEIEEDEHEELIKLLHIDPEVTDITIPDDLFSCVKYKTITHESVDDLLGFERKIKIKKIIEKI